jgi:hypothetical protein
MADTFCAQLLPIVRDDRADCWELRRSVDCDENRQGLKSISKGRAGRELSQIYQSQRVTRPGNMLCIEKLALLVVA